MTKGKVALYLSTVIITISIFSLSVFAANNAIISADNVNLRFSPSTSSKIISNLPKGTLVNIATVEGDWSSIVTGEKTGWVYSDFITISKLVLGTAKITGSNVNLRSEPSSNGTKITQMRKNLVVSVYEYSGEWAKISLNDGTTGWVSKNFLSVTTSISSRSSDGSERGVVETQVTDIAQEIVVYAKDLIGINYVYGGTTTRGFDCSGFVQHVYKNSGITLSRTAESQGSDGTKVLKSELKTGDLVFFDTNGGLNRIEHVGIYLGDGKFIHCSSGSTRGVTISDLTEGFYSRSYMTARRYF